jgi:hypothetical protein
MLAKWFIGERDVDEMISLIERRMKSMDDQLGEIRELLKGLPLAIATAMELGVKKKK